MEVLKFGGTSMGSPDSIFGSVLPIIRATAKRSGPPAVVVSAMTGITSSLLTLAHAAVEESFVDQKLLRSIATRHDAVISQIPRAAFADEAREYLDGELGNLRNLLKALTVIRELSPRSHDAIIALGEKFSAKVFACVLQAHDISAQFVDLEKLIPQSLRYTSDNYWDEVERLIAERLAAVGSKSVPVITGFFGPTQNGILADVGRGYSDYCASLTGAALRSPEIQIWTDVDGVLSANPKVVPEAFILRSLSFDEMAELAQFGAKVLHPFSVRPAVLKKIPIRILNTFNPEDQGTEISPETTSSTLPFKSVASKKGISVITLSTPRMLLAHGFIARFGEVLSRHQISVDLIATSEVSVSFSIDQSLENREPFLEDLKSLGEVAVEKDLAIISVVGSELAHSGAIPRRVFAAFEDNGLEPGMISFGNGRINLSITVHDADADRAVQVIHREFFKGVQQ